MTCPPHDWDVVKTAQAGTEDTYTWKCKNCPVEIEVDA